MLLLVDLIRKTILQTCSDTKGIHSKRPLNANKSTHRAGYLGKRVNSADTVPFNQLADSCDFCHA